MWHLNAGGGAVHSINSSHSQFLNNRGTLAHRDAGGGAVHSIISEQPSLPVVEAAMYNVKVCTSMLKSC
jgi:hypothetical protein